jgi:hypothetical protein
MTEDDGWTIVDVLNTRQYTPYPAAARSLCAMCASARDFVYKIGVYGYRHSVPLSVNSDSHCKL